MHRLEWKARANLELLQVALRIARQNPLAATTFLSEVATKTERLRERPTLYRRGRVPKTRELVVHPNYIIIYRVIGDLVEILRVKHAAQRWPEEH